MECRKEECHEEAVCTLAIEIYAVKAVMDFYKTYTPLSRSVVTLELCKKHGDETKLEDFVPPDQLEKMARIIEIHTGTMVDRAATKCFPVPLNHPQYLFLLQQQAKGQAKSNEK